MYMQYGRRSQAVPKGRHIISFQCKHAWSAQQQLVLTCSHHQGAFHHLQLKRRLLILPFFVVIVVAAVLSQHPGAFIGCQAWSYTLQKLFALRIVGLKQQAAVRCDDSPAYIHSCATSADA